MISQILTECIRLNTYGGRRGSVLLFPNCVYAMSWIGQFENHGRRIFELLLGGDVDSLKNPRSFLLEKSELSD